MAENKKKKSGFGWYVVVLEVYALAVLIAAIFGLRWFQGYLQAYEDSQMYHSLDAYMENLDTEKPFEAVDALIEKTDSKLQVRQDCVDLIEEAISGGITCARNRKLSTENEVVYMLLSGDKTVGRFSLVTTEPDEYGHIGWTAGETSYNFDFLLSGLHNTSLTVPSSYTVTVNGYPLDESYITKTGMHFAELEEFYKDYDLPERVTYTTGYVLGTLDVQITDDKGNHVTQEQADDDSYVLNNCTDDEKARLEEFMTRYIKQYVKFMSSNNDDRDNQYKKLLTLIAKDSFLRTRMKASLDGLQWTNDFDHSVASITMNSFYRMTDKLYMCDVTYVGVTKLGGVTKNESVNNMKMIVVADGDSFLAEASQSY